MECKNPKLGDSCDECENCRQVESGTFPDVFQVFPDSGSGKIRIEQIRMLANGLALTPLGEGWKVGLVDGADSMTEEAAYACLRILEEPPEKSVLILTAAGLHRIPGTLVSRCHVVRCLPQGIRQVAQFLERSEQIASAQAQMLAAFSGGRLGRALEYHRGNRLAVKNAALDQLLEGFQQQLPEIPLSTASRLEVEEALEWLAGWWRDVLVLSLKGDPAWLVHQDRFEEIDRKKEEGSVERLLDQLEKVYWVHEMIQRNASARIALASLMCGSSQKRLSDG